MNKRYFITGCTGMLGKHLMLRLFGDKYLFSRGQDPAVAIQYEPDVIYHLAGEIYEDSLMVESNILLTHQLLEAARKLPKLKAFIYIGSSSEYGRKNHPMTETDYLDPTTMYEATKGAGTLLCQAYARTYNVPVVIARPFSLYGKFEPPKRFIPVVIKSVKRGDIVQIAPGVHDFIHIDDFIDGLFLLENNPKKGEIYNFGTGVQTSNEEVVTLVEKLLKKKTDRRYIASIHSYDSTCWVADARKAHSLGWKPKYTLETGLHEVIRATTVQGKHL